VGPDPNFFHRILTNFGSYWPLFLITDLFYRTLTSHALTQHAAANSILCISLALDLVEPGSGRIIIVINLCGQLRTSAKSGQGRKCVGKSSFAMSRHPSLFQSLLDESSSADDDELILSAAEIVGSHSQPTRNTWWFYPRTYCHVWG
jgi:hypothetical protein